MNNPQNLHNDQQKQLIKELVAEYGITQEEITFFNNDPDPTLGYEALCVMCNFLAPEIVQIDVNPIGNPFADSLAVRCSLADANGRTRSAVGVVNTLEQIRNAVMSPQELYGTATSRAIRNALRVAGIDLLKRHAQRRQGLPLNAAPGKSMRETLLAQVHILGAEAGLIVHYTNGVDKTGWKGFLMKRYGVESSRSLSDEHLSDLASVLSGITAPLKQAA